MKKKEITVNAILIGAGRSGTTTLYEYLKNHSEVEFSTIKEVHYFSVQGLYKRGREYLHTFFKEATKIKVTADTYLLADTDAPKKILDYKTDIKIIIILRDPIERAFSGYNYARNFGYLPESTSFEEATENENRVLLENDIIRTNNLCNMYQSLYGKHITNWLKYFENKDLLILKTSELKNNPESVLLKMSDFLDISNFKKIKNKIKTNTAAKAKSKKLQQVLLNRDLPIRKVLRNLIPPFAKQAIIRSGVIKKASALNKTKSKLCNITEKEHKFAEEYFKDDLKLLLNKTGIKL